MIGEIAASLYRVEIPLPHNPLRSTNSYFIKARERSLIIDSGMNLPECREVFLAALKNLDIDLNKTDFFITHFHVDHLELATYLAAGTSKIYLNRIETTALSNPNGWAAFQAFYLAHGFPADELRKMAENHLAQGYLSGRFEHDFECINENDKIQIGDYSFQCLSTPGHSPGHTCLYEPDKKILISGDHVLFDITPNITGWPSVENALKDYLINLDKIYPLDVNLVLPGHRSIQDNHKKRIVELKEHHRARAKETLETLDSKGKTAYQVAPLVSWDVDFKSWEQFPTPQKFFAVGETIAHLRYLEGEGAIHSELKNNIILFFPGAALREKN